MTIVKVENNLTKLLTWIESSVMLEHFSCFISSQSLFFNELGIPYLAGKSLLQRLSSTLLKLQVSVLLNKPKRTGDCSEEDPSYH